MSVKISRERKNKLITTNIGNFQNHTWTKRGWGNKAVSWSISAWLHAKLNTITYPKNEYKTVCLLKDPHKWVLQINNSNLGSYLLQENFIVKFFKFYYKRSVKSM